MNDHSLYAYSACADFIYLLLSFPISRPSRSECVCRLGSQFRRGAGVLDMVFESPFQLFTCGYDTFIRLWDLRLSNGYARSSLFVTLNSLCSSQWILNSVIYRIESSEITEFSTPVHVIELRITFLLLVSTVQPFTPTRALLTGLQGVLPAVR